MKKIKFIAQGSNSALGGFTTGDVARCDDELAKHLVDEARVAEYVEAKVPEEDIKKGRGK